MAPAILDFRLLKASSAAYCSLLTGWGEECQVVFCSGDFSAFCPLEFSLPKQWKTGSLKIVQRT